MSFYFKNFLRQNVRENIAGVDVTIWNFGRHRKKYTSLVYGLVLEILWKFGKKAEVFKKLNDKLLSIISLSI